MDATCARRSCARHWSSRASARASACGAIRSTAAGKRTRGSTTPRRSARACAQPGTASSNLPASRMATATSLSCATTASTRRCTRTSAASQCAAARASPRTTPSASSARPAGPPGRIYTTSFVSPARRAIRSRLRCPRASRYRRKASPRSTRKPSRSSRGSICSRTLTSRCWNKSWVPAFAGTTSGTCLDRERRPATAGALRVGVLDDELRAFQAFLVVDLGAHQILVAHRVDEQHHAVLLHHGVVFVLHLVESEAVLEAGAAAAGNEDPELELGIALFLDQLLHFVRRAVAELERRRHVGHCTHLLLLIMNSMRALARRPSSLLRDAPGGLQPRRLDGFRCSYSTHPL